MTFASEVSIKVSTSAENRLWNIYFPGLPRHDEMISFPWRRVLIGRDADDLYQRLMTNMGQWLCVGSGDEWGEPGKMGPRAQRLAYISFHPPWLFHPNFFFLPLNGLFSPVCPMNYVNVYGIPFSRGQRKKRLKLEKCLLLTFFSSLRCLWTTFHVGSVGLGFSSAAMWKDDGGCWVGGGGGSGHNDIYEELRRQAGKECLPCCWTAWHWLMRERKTESEKRENKKRGVALV